MKTPTPKKTPATTTSVTKIKKNIIRSPTKAKPVGTAYGGSIDTLETAVSDIVISIVSKNDGLQGAYIKPIIDAWRSDDEITSDWYMDSVIPRRDGGANEPMKTSIGLPYNWDCVVTLRGNYQETPTEIGRKLAASFSAFSTPEFEQKNFQWKGDITSSPPASLNKYLLDKDCIMYLKKIYFGVRKESIMEDEEALVDFFGTVKEGKRVLLEISDAEWERKMW